MATIRSILGDIEGSAGQLTFAKVNGKNILRQKVGSNSSNTPAQQDTRARFKFLGGLYQAMKAALLAGLPKRNGRSAYNQFVGLNFDVTSYDANTMAASIDTAAMVLSGGSVAGVEDLTAVKTQNGVQLNWTDNSADASALPGDMVRTVVRNKVTGQVFTQVNGRSDAGSGYAQAALAGAQAANLEAYAFAVRADGSDASPTSHDQVA